MSELAEIGVKFLSSIADVSALTKAMLKEPQADCPVVHHFGPGVCMREVRAAKGVMAIGHEQKHEHLNLMLSGKVLLSLGDSVTELTAPAIFVAPPGRKMFFVLEDMVWMNIYSTELTDVNQIEDYFLGKNEDWAEDYALRFQAEQFQNEYARIDYFALLAEQGIAPDSAREQSYAEDDRMDVKSSILRLAPSPIEGIGLFLTASVKQGSLICPARVNGMRTQAERYVNHSPTPNAFFVVLPNGDIDLVALTDIVGCLGGNLGTELTVDYRKTVVLEEIG